MSSCNESLETLYLPSRWSKRYSREVIVDKHVEFACKESEKARQSTPSTLNIPYGPLEKEKIDIFGTDLPADAPILAFVHGGYWQEESLKRDTYHFISKNLHKNGIKTIFVGYELCPKVSLHKIVQEIEIATKKCVAYAKESKTKCLYLSGYSAGCQLVASLYTNLAKNFTDEERGIVKGVILIAGIYDLTQLPKTSINVPLKLSEEEAVMLSPHKQTLVPNQIAKFYIIAAENDSPEFIKQSKNFNQKLITQGYDATSVVARNVDHFDVVELLTDENFEITQLLINALLGEYQS